MNTISDIMFWISNGLLVPDIVLLIFLFFRALLLVGSFFGQYLSIRKTDKIANWSKEAAIGVSLVDELGMKVPKGIWDMLAQSVSDLESEVRGLANSIEMMGSEGSDIMECVRGIREMERTLDRAYYEMTKTIFRADIDPKAVIMLLRIVDAIEMAADTCKACSDTVAILHYAKRV